MECKYLMGSVCAKEVGWKENQESHAEPDRRVLRRG